MYKKIFILLSLVVSLNALADDNSDIKYINKLYQNREYKIALEETEKFILKYPMSKHYNVAQFLYGQSLYQLKDYEKAQKAFGKLQNTIYSNDANFYMALINIETGNLDKAYDYSKTLKDINREKILYSLAIKELSNNNLKKSRDYFEELRKIKGVYKNYALFYLGLISYNSNSYLDTNIYLNEYLLNEKEDIEKIATSNYMLAYSYDKLGNKDTALGYYKNIEENYSGSTYYNLALRDLFFYWVEEKNDEKILEYINKLTGTDYEETVLLNAGNYYYNNQNNLKAIYYYEKLLKNYTNSEAMLYLARAYMNSGKNEEAINQLKKLSLNSKYTNEYYYYTAYTYFQSGQYQEVIALLDGIENKINKDQSSYYRLIADSSYKLQDYKKAQKYYGLIFNDKKTKDDFYRYYLASSQEGDIKTTKELFSYYKSNFAKETVYNESVYLIMGDTYVKLGEDVNAENIYSEGLKNEYSEQLLESLVMVQLKMNKYEEAYKNMNKLDSNEDREFTKATILINLKKYSEAKENFQRLLKESKSPVLSGKILTKLSEIYILEKNYEEVISVAEKHEASGYEFEKVLYENKAIAYFKLEQYDKSRETYEKISAMEKDKGSSYYMIAETYYNESKYTEAKEYYKKAYAATTNDKVKKDSAYWLIRVENILGNEAEFLNRVKAFREIYPNSDHEEDIIYLVANKYEEKNDYKSAIKEYAKLYEISGDVETKDEAAKRITELYTSAKDIKNAYIWSNKVSEEAYKYLWQAYILELEGKKEAAIKNYEKISNDKNYGDSANYKLGLYYMEKGDFTKSRLYFEKVLTYEASVNGERAQYNIGLTYEKEKEYMKAISSFLRIKLLFEESELDNQILIKLGENYEKLNDYEKGSQYYKEYLSKYTADKDYVYVLEKLLVNRIKVNNNTESKEYYNELLKINPSAAKKYAEYIK